MNPLDIIVWTIPIFGLYIATKECDLINKATILLVSSYGALIVIYETSQVGLYVSLDDIIFSAILMLLIYKNKLGKVCQGADIRMKYFLCIAFFSTIFSYLVFGIAAYGLFLFFGLFKLFLSYCIGKHFSGKQQSVYLTISFSAIVLSFTAFLQSAEVLPGYTPFSTYIQRRSFESTSLLGDNPAHFGLFMTLGLYACACLLGPKITNHQYWEKDTNIAPANYYEIHPWKHNMVLAFLLIAGVFFTSTLMSDSRASILAFMLSLIIYSLYIKRFLLFIWPPFILLILFFPSFFLGIEISGRDILSILHSWLSEGDVASARYRIIVFQKAMEFIYENPEILLTGVGYGNWRNVMFEVTAASGGHNVYLTLLIETGLLGLMFFCFFLSFLIWNGCKHRNPIIMVLVPVMIASFSGDWLLPQQALEHFAFLIFFLLGMEERSMSIVQKDFPNTHFLDLSPRREFS